MRWAVLAVLPLLASCAEVQQRRNQAGDLKVQVGYDLLVSGDRYRCLEAPIGSVKARYGTTDELRNAYLQTCAALFNAEMPLLVPDDAE